MKKLSVEGLFIIIAFVFGLLLIFVVPPFQSPDEDTHFMKSYLISEGDWYPKGNEKKGYDISSRMFSYIQEKKAMMGNNEAKYSYSDQYVDQLMSSSYDETIFTSISTQETTPIAHIVPAIGVGLAKVCKAFDNGADVGPAVLLQFARILCLVVYSIIGFLAIKITPKYKKLFFTILLLPSVTFLRSMVTYDSLLMVITALFVAKIFQIYCDENYRIKKRDIVLFVLCAYILLNIKTVYVIVIVAVLFLPRERFNSLKGKIKCIAIIACIVIAVTFILKMPNMIEAESVSNEITMAQRAFILENPLQAGKIVIKNIIYQMRQQLYWMVGTYGLIDTYIPVLALVLIYINLIIAYIKDIFTEKVRFSKWFNITMLVLIILSFVAIYGVMYMSWTPLSDGIVGGESVSGVQGRYFLPYLIMLPFVFSNGIAIVINKIVVGKRESRVYKYLKKACTLYDEFYYVLPCIFLVIMLFTLVVRYWI